MASSKAEVRSNAARQTPSSSKEGEYSGTFVRVQGITELNWHFEYGNAISLELGPKQGQVVLT